MNVIGIRVEDKNKWERRVPLVPSHVEELIKEKNIEFIVQSSSIRAFSDKEYSEAGAKIAEGIEKADVILAIKEVPIDYIYPNKVYMFFSHTIKGQKHNMPMLKHIINSKVTLIDYEKIIDDSGRRLVFFGNWAGLAGMNQTLWAFGQRMQLENVQIPFVRLKHTYEYSDVHEMKKAIKEVGKDIEENGLDERVVPLICGFAGYGNVSRGAQEILDQLPVIELQPEKLEEFIKKGEFSKNHVYKVVFKEEHMVKPKDPKDSFELFDYYKTGSAKYEGIFSQYLPHLSILINAIYWSDKYPRVVTKEDIKNIIDQNGKLKVIGDISCDIEGGIEGTLFATKPDNPVLTYNPYTDKATIGFSTPGMAIMAVDNLPCELPKESSTSFSTSLKPFIEDLAQADFTVDFNSLSLPPILKRAVIVFKGKLTPDYEYLEKFL